MSKMRDGPAKNAVKQGGKAKIGEREIDLKKVTPKSDSYFGAGYSDFYGYDSAVQTAEKKVKNLDKRQVKTYLENAEICSHSLQNRVNVNYEIEFTEY